MSALVVAGSNTSTPNRPAPAYAAASTRFLVTDLVRVGGATFIDTASAAVAGDRGAPPLQALGQRVVRPLLGDQAVADAGIGSGRIGRAEQPAAGQRPQQPAAELVRR